MDQWYFAYGSNLCVRQMIARVGWTRLDDEPPRIARLPGYRLAFNMLANDGCVYANIVQPGSGVHGVTYCCTEEMLKKLDVFEFGYERRQVVVTDPSGHEMRAIAYVAMPETITTEGKPAGHYVRTILAGAREHGLPENYIRAIQTLPQEHDSR